MKRFHRVVRNDVVVRVFEKLALNAWLLKRRFSRFGNSLGVAASDLYGGNYPARFSSEVGDEIMSGAMRVVPWLDSMPYSDIEAFDWNVEYTQTPTTYQLLLQALNPIMYLSGAYVLSGNEDYFWKAYSIYKAWKKFDQSEASDDNRYVWDQHAAALRTESLLGLLLVGVEKGLLAKGQVREIEVSLYGHAKFHMDGDMYLAGENHGLYQDRALLYLGYAFSCEDWIETATKRIKDQWYCLFDEEGVCAENSFAYQRVDKNLFIDVYYLLKKKGNPFARSLYSEICKAEDFMGYSLMPNGVCPPYGDTLRHDHSMCSAMDEAGVLSYASSRGAKGQIPSHARKLYYQAGYYFGREFWVPPAPDDCFENAVWTMFRSGYSSITHRQSDDNSFMLYAFGKEIFTDGGAYNYMFRDPIRIYVRSVLAHNSIFVDGKSYDFLRKDNTGLVGFCHHQLGVGGIADYIVAFNGLYYGVAWLRHFVFFGDAVFLLDELFSAKEHIYSQVFHCGPEVERVEIEGHDARIVADGERQRLVSLQQLSSSENLALTVYEGGEDSLSQDVPFGITGGSELNEIEYITTLVYQQSGCSVSFATLLLACDGRERDGEVAYDSVERRLTINGGAGPIEIGLKTFDPQDFLPRSDFDFSDVSIEKEGSLFRFRYADASVQGFELAWYVMGNHGKRPLCKGSYAPESSFEFDFSDVEDPDCAIRVFVRDLKTGMGGSQTICGIRRGFDDGEWRCEYWPDWDEGWRGWFGGTEAPFRSAP